MSSKGLRKYMVNNLDAVDRLRREVPEALKRAHNVPRLVLDTIGRFYNKSEKAYRSDNKYAVHSIPKRRGCILLLELYLLTFSPALDANRSCKEDAAAAAKLWRKRILQDGGIDSAGAVDALGLVLLLASFGIPPLFSPQDLATLLRLSNLKKKAVVFRRSPILLEKMPDIIRDLIAKGMQVEAVDLICAFELGREFPLRPLLSSFVRKASEVTKERNEGQCSTRSLKEANEKQLFALKSVVKCLEEHNLDASELLSLNINQMIANLEREISVMGQNLQDKNSKRKFEVVKPFKSPEPQAKRPSSASSAETSHGLRDGSGIGLVAGSVHGRAGGWHGNGVAYQTSAGQSLPGIPHVSGGNFTGHPAAAGQSLYHPPALPHEMGGMDSGKNFSHFSDTVLRREPYYSKLTTSNDMPTAANTGQYFSNAVPAGPNTDHHLSNVVSAAPKTSHHLSNAVPAAPNTGHHLSKAVPAAPNTGHHLSNSALAAPNTGHHLSNAVPTVPNTGHHLSKAVPAAPNTGHHLSNAVPAAPNTRHHFTYAVPAAPNTSHHLSNAVPAAPDTGHQLSNAVPAAPNTGHQLSNAVPAVPNSGHHFTYAVPAAPNTSHHLSNVVPAPPNSGLHLSNAVPAAQNTGHHLSNAMPAAQNTGHHLSNAVPAALNTGHRISNAVPAAPNTSHHFSYAVPASPNTGHHFSNVVHGYPSTSHHLNNAVPAAPNSSHHLSNAVPAAPNTGHHLRNAMPAASNTGHHLSNVVPAASNTGHHFSNAVPAASNTGHHFSNAMPATPNTGHHFSYAVPAAPNTGHHLSNAMPAAPNTGHHLPVEFASAPFGNSGSYNRSH